MVALAGKQWVIDQEQNIQEKTVNVNNKVYSFKTAPVIENLQLGSVNKNNTINEKDVLSAKIENFATEVKKHGIELYKGAYEKLEEVTVYKLPSLSAGEDITEEDKAKVAVALEKSTQTLLQLKQPIRLILLHSMLLMLLIKQLQQLMESLSS